MDEMDSYLGRSLKNWVAQHHPPANGRDQLLKNALYTSHLEEYSVVDWFTQFRGNPTRRSSRLNLVNSEPMTQSRLWFFQLSTNFRLAN